MSAVRQGRALYDNILKFVRFQLSTTMGAIFTLFFSPLIGLPDAFNPIQILWVAMIMDGPPAVSLALDAARPGIMDEPPRQRTESVLPLSRLVHVVAFGLLMMIGTLGVHRFGLQTGTQTRALTLAFTTFVLFQFFNVFNARVERASCLQPALLHQPDALVVAGRRRRAAGSRRALAPGPGGLPHDRVERVRLGDVRRRRLERAGPGGGPQAGGPAIGLRAASRFGAA